MVHGGSTKGSKYPFVIGSATSGVLEILLFHPIDTIAKRLMSNTAEINNMSTLSKILFKDAQNKGVIGKWLSLFPGVSFGAAYKVLQRTYKFGSQPILRNFMREKYGDSYKATFGKNSHDMLNASAGALVGIGEVFLLPLDVLKIKSQTNPEVLQGRGFIDLVVKENFKLYRGIGWTMARNCPGSFALFGANSLVYTRMFGVSGPREAKGYQIVVGSLSGGVASIVVSSPLDVIKTRVQNKPFDDNRSGFKVVTDLMKEEGPSAFFKGLTPKIGLIGPKLVFSFTVAQALIAKLQGVWEEKGWN
mmetsp:Transcript_29934/g.36697  ORF Transcript_29934/g.36697 Transcript_29934/m.36697 type:complete len:304 (+) Transcript_29934:144-1055(+)